MGKNAKHLQAMAAKAQQKQLNQRIKSAENEMAAINQEVNRINSHLDMLEHRRAWLLDLLNSAEERAIKHDSALVGADGKKPENGFRARYDALGKIYNEVTGRFLGYQEQLKRHFERSQELQAIINPKVLRDAKIDAKEENRQGSNMGGNSEVPGAEPPPTS